MQRLGQEPGRGTLLLLGASVRALAASVLQSRRALARFPGGLLLLDFFADDDFAREPRVRFADLAGEGVARGGAGPDGLPRTTAGLGRAALALASGGWRWDGLAFTGGLENRPGLLRLLARGAPILGNDPAAVASVRDPDRLAAFLEREGVLHAGVSRPDIASREGTWLFKRRRGAGGSGVRAAMPGERRRPGEYLQARLDGPAASIAFVANGSDARILGASLEIPSSGTDASLENAPRGTGNASIPALAAPSFRYAGNIAGPIGDLLPPEALATLRRAANRIAARYELRGLNGIDFILTDRGPVLLEVNPRFTASMEILEALQGASFFDAHLDALDGRLGPRDAAPRTGWMAKGILYSVGSVVAPDPGALMPLGVRDRPRRGQTFEPGRPLCTLVVEGTGADDCRRRVAERAAEVRRLFPPCAPASA